MATHLILLCCSATASSRSGAFPRADEPLDPPGAAKARARAIGRMPDSVVGSPTRAARETADAMGMPAVADPRLADMDFGRWNGRSLAEVNAAEPARLAAWLAEPEGGAPGGETLDQVRTRIRSWLAELEAAGGRVLAITHPFVVRAALAEALDLPSRSVTRFDVAPLSTTILSFTSGWRLQQLGAG